ncbi:hypothetical protein [Pseudorhodoferax sp. Leaf274]|uniref:hypothetical protein n=1 Tax=Pseudorhodoferax sp. Leaf274 TaxID=1736318 RepID=UPI0007035D40|nr:hypothetical protein [Pseudorhodoferax sp. Leaf274]KQP36115.1 hypothetical protein ASF44_16225 [Pseudorhodoferax sp. Leaf274]
MAYPTTDRPSKLRKPIAMLRGNEDEEAELDQLVELYGGGERAAVLREVLLSVAREKRHEANSLSHRRMGSKLDKSAFGRLLAA